MNIKVGDKVLVNVDDWFFAPDGEQYRAVWGTVKGIYSDVDTLGIKTDARSTNWYLEVGDMVVAGCRIHYVIKCDTCSSKPPTRDLEYNGQLYSKEESNPRVWVQND